jgi:hypothetical protein
MIYYNNVSTQFSNNTQLNTCFTVFFDPIRHIVIYLRYINYYLKWLIVHINVIIGLYRGEMFLFASWLFRCLKLASTIFFFKKENGTKRKTNLGIIILVFYGYTGLKVKCDIRACVTQDFCNSY